MGQPARWQQVLGGVAAAAVLYRQRCSASLIVAQWISGEGEGAKQVTGLKGLLSEKMPQNGHALPCS